MRGLNKYNGNAVNDLFGHVSQSINDILTTLIGTRLARRNYGSNVPELIDQPLNAITQIKLYAATATALMTWEPRLKVSHIEFAVTPPAGASLTINGTVNGADYSETIPLRAT